MMPEPPSRAQGAREGLQTRFRRASGRPGGKKNPENPRFRCVSPFTVALGFPYD
ncbi:MAG: hypothetical protein KatS3mg005_1668 [Bryobacteraceae bacterium]|nr:MAG: hypothetical protein KatS3mg005_1668 [Bryobacteraceae bacterium]